ncbi:tyrosyl-tRNA synthetase [Thoreauomyces humboldtii]|nr:tyrosyl-tRNA synthetase [Thoreauomyces humboldtii]
MRSHLATSAQRCIHTATQLASTPVIARMQERGLIQAMSSPSIAQTFEARKHTLYTGFDPTATSLHVGNLLMIVGMLHFQAAGHRAIALVGGATGAIGDPSGKSSERKALGDVELTGNVTAISEQIRRVFSNARSYMERRDADVVSPDAVRPVEVLNNLDWFQNVRLVDFLGDVGRLARVSVMLGRDSVRNRLESPEGISFTEFSYQLLQAYDFHHLHRHHGCTLQLGGSDQWGNIMAGLDVIRRKAGRVSITAAEQETEAEPLAYGLTMPLVTTAKGEKFGKSEGNAVWLDPARCSPYEFYQFFRRTPDTEVQRLLQYFTMVPMSTIEETMATHASQPGKHLPQRLLAYEVTELVHGEQSAQKAQTMSTVCFDGTLAETRGDHIVGAFEGDDRLVTLSRDQVLGSDIVQVAVAGGAVKSKSAGRKLLASGGLYLNSVKVEAGGHVLTDRDLIDDVVCVIRVGKNQQRVIRVSP